MPYITQNNQQLFYTYNKSKANAPALLLVHGAGSDHNCWPQGWRQSAPASAQSGLSAFPVYALDLPGHGHSDPPGCRSIDNYAQSVLNFTNNLDLEKVIIVGHSMGGAIAQAIGAQQPPNLAGLVLIGTGARLPVNQMILDGLQTDFPGTAQMIMKFAWHNESDPAPKQQATKRLLNTSPDVVYNDFAACNEFNLSHQLDKIQVPTLVIGSADDKMTPLKYSHFLAEQIPNAQLAVIEKAGHYMMVEKSAEVMAAILSFLNQPSDFLKP